MDDDGLFFLESLRSEYVSPQPVFWAPTWGCCSTGELLPQMRSKGSKTGTAAASRASCYIRCGIGVPQLGLLQSHGRGQRLLNTSFSPSSSSAPHGRRNRSPSLMLLACLLSTTMHCDTVQLLRQSAFSTRCAHARRQLMQPWLCGTPKSSRLLVLDPFATKLGLLQSPAPASRAIRKDHHTQAGHLPGQRTFEHHRRRFLPLTSDAKARRLASPPMAT